MSNGGPADRPSIANPQRSPTMKVMVFIKATRNSEKGLPSPEVLKKMFAEMGAFNEKLVKAGVMQGGDGLKPSKFGKRVTFTTGSKRSVTDGPFAETKELIAGYWIWEVKSMEEAVDWVMQCPDPMPGEESNIEIRPLYTLEDFGVEFTQEELQAFERQRQEMQQQASR
jgi:hypothetical protein